ncbi:hypothetical protein [Herminiimonas aquatilis]|uniref:Uncharacterized protein n=1 Tax=Herminiimonas aquatilis TaxID=345342 RepID=A0ABW2J7L0_9BURK
MTVDQKLRQVRKADKFDRDNKDWLRAEDLNGCGCHFTAIQTLSFGKSFLNKSQ